MRLIFVRTPRIDHPVAGNPRRDKEIDAECGRNAGVRTIRVQTGFQRNTTGTIADWVAPNLVDATKIIVGLVNE